MEEWAQTRQIDKLKKVACSSDQQKKIIAIDLLGQSAHPEAAGFLFEHLQTQNSEVRCHAAIALGRLGAEVGLSDIIVEDLIDLLTSTAYQDRAAIAETLGMIGDYAAVNPLLEIADNEQGRLQQVAIIALGEILDWGKLKGGLEPNAIFKVLNRIVGATTNQQVRAEAERVLRKINP
jgi:HEAT repeat protein